MRLINKKTADYYKEQGIPSFKGEMGDVLVEEDCLPFNDDATFQFDLVKFFGIGSVTLAVA